MNLQAYAARAAELDATDPLAAYRDEFRQPESRDGLEAVYLCGNSLGLMPGRAAAAVAGELDNWGRLAVRGHFDGADPWMPYHERARGPLARLVGAHEDEVVLMNALTVNLHLMLVSFYRPAGPRRRIVIEQGAFPSDLFAVRSQIAWHGLDPDECLLEWRRDDNGRLCYGELEALLQRHADEVALLLLPGVQYYSGQVLDTRRLVGLAAEHGALLGLDLAHAAGNVPLALHDDGVDFAVWCTYKYLNGGPGATAATFVHRRHFGADRPRLLGWWSHDKATRFRMGPQYVAAAGVDAWMISNTAILSTAPVLASLAIFDAAGMAALRDKSIRLTGFMAELLQAGFADTVEIITPQNPAERGCQLSLTIRPGRVPPRTVFERLDAANVIGDWREPDAIRVAPTPLYNRFGDVVEFARRLAAALDGG